MPLRCALAALVVLACGHGKSGSDAGSVGAGSVGASGGTVSLAGGPTLQFPAGAVSASTSVTVQQTTQNAAGGGPIFQFGPEGATFAAAVAVTFPVPSGIATPVVYWSKPGSSTQFEALATTQVAGGVQAQVTHFSMGCVAPPCGAACTPSGSCPSGTATVDCSSGAPVCACGTVPVASVDVQPASSTLAIGKTLQLQATPKDANGNALAGRAVAWSSSSGNVTVSTSGLATAVSDGSATITATSESKSGTATVNGAAPVLSIGGQTSFPIALKLQPICLPDDNAVSFVIGNAGASQTTLDYTVADDGSLGGFLNITNATGSLPGGSTQSITVTVKPEFVGTQPSLVGDSLVVNVYTPKAKNYVKVPVGVDIVGYSAMAQKLVGTWSGSWSGTSTGRNVAGSGQATAAVSGSWVLDVQSVSVSDSASGQNIGTATGTLSWTGQDAYFTYTTDGSGNITGATAHTFVPDRTISFGASNTTVNVLAAGWCGAAHFNLGIDGFAGAANPSDAFYGPRFSPDLFGLTNQAVAYGAGWSAHPYDPATMDTGVSSGGATGMR
jgi:hypothetical protein